MTPTPSVFLASTGHDSPAYHRREDLYNRWPVATAISRALAASPSAWSTRVGLFGGWGEGKTSVLNFLEQEQLAAKNIVVRFSPWGATSDEEIWSGFAKSLRNALKRTRVSVPIWTRVKYTARALTGQGTSSIRAAGKATKAPGAAAGTEFAANLIDKHLKVTRRDVEEMVHYIQDRRIIVFIDDLDRTDPKLIPNLLLALRDLLDFAQLAFVLSFDRSIIAKSLEAHNAAWSQSVHSFLDKVIDFPFELPHPTAAQVRALALDQFEKVCDFVPRECVEDLASVLPSNPRKLKLLARILAATRTEAERHEKGELRWNIVILYALLRLESSSLAAELLLMSTDLGPNNRWLQYGMSSNDDERAAQERAAVKALVKRHDQSHNEERISQLVTAWRENIPAVFGESIRYQAMFTVSPHQITWGEFKDFFAEWRADTSGRNPSDFVEALGSGSENKLAATRQEFGEAIVAYYSSVLSQAADVTSQDKHEILMEEAFDILKLARLAIVRNDLQLTQDFRESLWKKLYDLMLQWRHFNSNPKEPELRSAETSLLQDFAACLGNGLFVYEEIQLGSDRHAAWGKREAELREQLTRAIQDSIIDEVSQNAISLIATPGQLKRLRNHELVGLRRLLGHPSSPVFTSKWKSQLLKAVVEREGTDRAVEDAIDYLGFLFSVLPRPDQRRDLFLEHADFTQALWNLVVSRPSQFRMLSTLRENREALLECGLSEAQVSNPQWLDMPSDSSRAET